MSQQKILVKYIRDSITNEPYGCVVALSPDEFGWSLCNKAAGDRFNKEKAKLIAIRRAQSGRTSKVQPAKHWVSEWKPDNESGNSFTCTTKKIDVVAQELDEIKERAERYFK